MHRRNPDLNQHHCQLWNFLVSQNDIIFKILFFNLNSISAYLWAPERLIYYFITLAIIFQLKKTRITACCWLWDPVQRSLVVVDLLQSCTSYPVGGPASSIHYPVSLRAVLVSIKLPGAFSPIEWVCSNSTCPTARQPSQILTSNKKASFSS